MIVSHESLLLIVWHLADSKKMALLSCCIFAYRIADEALLSCCIFAYRIADEALLFGHRFHYQRIMDFNQYLGMMNAAASLI